MMVNTRSFPILRCKKNQCLNTQDMVVREIGLRIVLSDSQGEENFAFIRTIPHEPEALVLGLLFTSRIISVPSDVLQMTVRNQLAKVRLDDRCNVHEKVMALRPTSRLVTGVCGPEESAIGVWQACDLLPVETSFTISPTIIHSAVKRLNSEMKIYRETGGTHGAALIAQNGNMLFLAEDVGRHNAVDRVIGKGFEESIDLASTLIVCSGRLTSDLVLKVAVARLSMIASISAAVDSGIELAEAAGITLIGFVRGARMNVYTHPNRLAILTG
ncbi:MAG: formate dehydrogenase accessory sulfurtransferase FdhD [Candidatus Thorarchaeota archaeon]